MPAVQCRRLIAIVGAVLLLEGCSAPSGGGEESGHTEFTPPASSPTITTTAPTGISTPSLTPSNEPLAEVKATPLEATRAALAQLPIKGRAPKTGYARTQFGQRWSDDVLTELGHNGCDTRNDILSRDLINKDYKPNTHECVVLAGQLIDPYTGTTILFKRGQNSSSAVQIDHVVALGDAWQKGAQQLSPEMRQDFANDPLNLLAVDGSANQQKRDGDAATWLPSNAAFRCQYVARQTAVKAKYQLWVTQTEHDAIEHWLDSCNSSDDAALSALFLGTPN